MIINFQIYFIFFSASGIWRQILVSRKKFVFRRRKRTVIMNTSSYFWVLNTAGKMMTCCHPGTNKFLRYRIWFIKATKMQMLIKRYRTYRVCVFWGTWSASVLRHLSLDHFGRLRTKICGIQMKLLSKRF